MAKTKFSADKANGGQTDRALHKPVSCLPAHEHEAPLDVPNEITAAAIEEGRKQMHDPHAPRYSSMDALKAALDA